jgi:hypothetical protein
MSNISSFETAEQYRDWYRNYREANREKIRKRHRSYMRIWREENEIEKKKGWARQQVAVALRKGGISQEKCSICGEEKVQAHHTDYSRPLEVIWLCFIHHKEQHKKGNL